MKRDENVRTKEEYEKRKGRSEEEKGVDGQVELSV